MMVSVSKKCSQIIPGLLLLLLGLGVFRPARAAEPSPDLPSGQAEGAPTSAFSVEGRLVPVFHASLATQLSGQAEEVPVAEGQQVSPGTVLLRLANREQLEADLAAAQFERLAAQQALDQLDDEVVLELALQQKALAEAQKELIFAQDKVRSLNAPTPQARLDQVYANLVLARWRLERVQDDIRFWEKRAANKKSIFWTFLKFDKGTFKDILENLDRLRIVAERRVEDAQEKYDDLLAPPDEIELAQAQANVGVVQARLAEIERQIALLETGPDPDDVLAAQARLRAAEADLAAAQAALEKAELVSPLSGKVAEVNVKTGEWVEAGQPAVILLDDSRWVVETDDLTEIEIPQVQVGQAVTIQPDALPELELAGTVEAIKPLYEEKRGDVTYTVRIALAEFDPRLRWGMTVNVNFDD